MISKIPLLGGLTPPCAAQIMMYMQIFIFTCDASAPFECPLKTRKDYSLVFDVNPEPKEGVPPYRVSLKAGDVRQTFLFAGSRAPIRALMPTATDPTFHTQPHEVSSEDDVVSCVGFERPRSTSYPHAPAATYAGRGGYPHCDSTPRLLLTSRPRSPTAASAPSP